MQDKLTSAAGAGGTHRWPARWAARLARHGVRRALFSVARPQSQSPLARAIFCLPLSRAHCLCLFFLARASTRASKVLPAARADPVGTHGNQAVGPLCTCPRVYWHMHPP